MDVKMYHFRYDGYGTVYTVAAFSPQWALNHLKDYLKKKSQELVDIQGNVKIFVDDYEDWRDATLEKMPKGYTLVEHSVGEVLEMDIN